MVTDPVVLQRIFKNQVGQAFNATDGIVHLLSRFVWNLFFLKGKPNKKENGELRKYARAEGVTLPPFEEISPSGGSNSPTVGARNLTQFGEKGKELQSNSIRLYVGQYQDVPRWRVSDTHVALSHDLLELMAKRTMESVLDKFIIDLIFIRP